MLSQRATEAMIDDLIRRLRVLDLPFHPPASPERCAALGRALDCDVPAEILALYRDHDGEGDGRGVVPLRLLSIEEALEFRDTAGDFTELGGQDLRAFWIDDNSNYAGPYVAGPLCGKVGIIDHDEADFSPVYRSVRSFLDALLDAAAADLDWYGMPTDYPVDRGVSTPEVRPASAAERQADWAVARSLMPGLEAVTDADRRRSLAYADMALTPPEQAGHLVPFLDEDDMWTQERACFLLGRWRYEAAVPRLAEVARTGQHNGRMAAVRALGRIGTPECLGSLLGLIAELGATYSPYLADALKGCGCEVQRVGSGWSYRPPDRGDWRDIR